MGRLSALNTIWVLYIFLNLRDIIIDESNKKNLFPHYINCWRIYCFSLEDEVLCVFHSSSHPSDKTKFELAFICKKYRFSPVERPHRDAIP